MSNPWDETLQARYGSKLKPKSALATDASETPEQTEARVRAEFTQYQKDVVTACELAGAPERAGAFIAANTPLSDVLAALARPVTAETNGRLTGEQRHQQRLAALKR
jgi:hypothetical protein